MNLVQQKCIPCSGASAPVNEAELSELKAQLPDWQVVEQNGELHLERVYKFRNFKIALAFTQQVGEEAEAQGHHPALLTEWGKVTVTWWTHVLGGLHQNDFIMAAQTDRIAEQFAD